MSEIVIPGAAAPARVTSVEPSKFSWSRDGVASILAVIIALVFATAVIWTLVVLGAAESYERAKELISVIGGFLGVVLGYYFQKSSSEGQVAAATNTAINAARSEAQTRSDAREVVDAARALLPNLVDEAAKAAPDRGHLRAKLEQLEIRLRR